MKREIRKWNLRIAFIFFTIVSLMYWNSVLCIKNDDGIKQAMAMYYQPRDMVDVVMMGSSHIHYAVNTGTLWEKYGISAFDYSAAEQPLWITYHYLKEFCKYQNPKVVVLDLYSPALRKEDYQYDWLLPNVLGMRFSMNKLEMFEVSVERQRIGEYFPSFAIYHDRLCELQAEDFLYPFISRSELVNFKGFKPMLKVTPQIKPAITQSHSGGLTIKSEVYLKKIIEYTKDNDIELFLIVTPYITNDDQELVYNRIREIAQMEAINFSSMNYDYEEIGIDFSKDFMDASHLNYYGAVKFTEYLGKELKYRYELADHRGDSKYDSWEKDNKNIAEQVN